MRDALDIARLTELQDELNADDLRELTDPDAAARFFVAQLDRDTPSIARQPRDVDGAELAELERRLVGEPISFSFSAGSWSAMTLTGEYSAHGDTFGELVDELLEQLPPTRLDRFPSDSSGSADYRHAVRAA